MNEAARLATGDVLLFHHADTEITAAHLESLRAAMSAVRGRRRRVPPPVRRAASAICAGSNRGRPCAAGLFGPLFGDQSIFVRRSVFEELGGFADIPLMEDVDFSCRLRRNHPLLSSWSRPFALRLASTFSRVRGRRRLQTVDAACVPVWGVTPIAPQALLPGAFFTNAITLERFKRRWTRCSLRGLIGVSRCRPPPVLSQMRPAPQASRPNAKNPRAVFSARVSELHSALYRQSRTGRRP